MDRYHELHRRYAALPNGGRAEDGFHYSPQSLQIFPRYHVAEAILTEIERLDPDRLPDPTSLVAALTRAGATAQTMFTQPPHGEIEAEVMAEERQRFAAAVQTWLAQPNLTAEPMAYRRVLAPHESSSWHGRMAARWGVHHRQWYPMIDASVPDDVLILQEAAMWDDDGTERVRELLAETGCTRVAELREFGADYVLDVSLFDPTYNGTEGVWTDDSLTWIAYASHEATVAFGGVLATGLPKA
jgi:hypothetical protein